MAKAERGFVPLHQVESDKLQVQAALPYVDPNEIGINVRRLERLMGLAGIATLKIAASEGEVTSSTPVIAGHDGHGHAFAGRIATKAKAVTHTVELLKPDDRCELHAFNWAHAQVTLNTSEVSDRISHDDTLRSPQAWSTYLDRAIRNGLSEAGFNHLGFGWKKEALIYDASTLVATTAPYAAFGLKGLLAGAAVMETFVNIIWPYVHSGTPNKCKNPHEKLRPTLLTGPDIPRAMALQAMTRIPGIVKSITTN